MWNKFLFTFLILASVTWITTTLAVNWVRYDSDHQYVKLNNTVHSFDDAVRLCIAVGGILPQPRNSGQDNFLNTMTQGGWFYIGLTDIRGEGRWKWNTDVGRSSLAWRNWKSGEPDGGREQNCAAHTVGGGNHWSNMWASVMCIFVYENPYDIPVVCEKQNPSNMFQPGIEYQDVWITDQRTKKQYLVLPTDTLNYDDLQEECEDHGGFLPEPQDERENTFLANLGTGTFMLGMTDSATEGQWVWPHYRIRPEPVAWQNWIEWYYYPHEPNDGRGANCVLVARQMYVYMPGHRADGWIDFPCDADDYLPADQPGATNPTLICENFYLEGQERHRLFFPRFGKRQTKKRNDLDIVSFNTMDGSPRHRVE